MDIVVTSFVLGVSFAVMFVMGLFFWRNHNNIRIRKILYTVLFCNAAALLKDILVLYDFVDCQVFQNTLLVMNTVLVGIDFLYVYELLRTGVISRKTVFLSTFPFILLTIAYFFSGSERLFYFSYVFCVVYVLVAIVNIIYYGRKYISSVRRNYSDSSRVYLSWLSKSVLFLIFLFLFWKVCFLGDLPIWYRSIYYLLLMVIWGYISYRTMGYEQLFVEDMEEEDTRSKRGAGFEDGRNANDSSEEELSETGASNDVRVHYHFETELEEMRMGDFFCNHPKISLVELSEILKTNRTTLSGYINNVLKITFYDLTNDARIRYAQELMASPDFNMTQEELAQKCGFSSLSTFRRVFIDKVGCTPKKFSSNLRSVETLSGDDSSN